MHQTSRVYVRIIPRMNRRRRTERDKIVSICMRLRACVLNIEIQLEKKLSFFSARLQ